ncbi:MAG: 2-phosphosulfolactate phosphatase [Clostridium sp.]|nr:2-phosphosulfolactate phosphatase [Clostridium sp.]
MKIDVVITGNNVTTDIVKDKVVIVIDILRATSVIITAISNGAKSVIPVTNVEEALKIRNKMENVVLGGERKAKKIDGFDLSNSPLEYSKENIQDKNVILTTTNGTKAITRSSSADKVYIGSLLNAKAVARKVNEENKDIVVVLAGTNDKFSIDDFLAAGAIINDILEIKEYNLTDIAKTSLLLFNTNSDLEELISNAYHYNLLLDLGLHGDIKYCLEKDILNIVPEFKNGIIKNYED